MMDKDKINKLPNSVSGDGRAFATQLKKALLEMSEGVEKKIDETEEQLSSDVEQLMEPITKLQTVPDVPTQFYLTWDEKGALWEWLYNDNGYVDYFELRLDANAGVWDEHCLERTRNSYSRVAPPERSGTAYLFVRNIFGTYSQPATHTFNKTLAVQPNPPTLTRLWNGVKIHMDDLPGGWDGYHIVINDVDEYTVSNNDFVYYQVSGTLSVKYAFVDAIGMSEYSGPLEMQINLIDNTIMPSVSFENFDARIKNAVEAAEAITGEIDTAISETLAELDVDGKIRTAVEDASELLGSQIAANTLQITQTDNRLTSLANTTAALGDTVSANTSAISQTSDQLTTLVNSTAATLDGRISSNTSLINQKAGEFSTALQEQVEELDGRISSNGSAIQQTAQSITAVVTELNKDPGECDYSAITALKEGVDLSVKEGNIISRINLSPELITIDGKRLHITGNTVFDDAVIIGANLKPSTIGSEQLNSKAVTTGKIDVGAVTSSKIANDAVTTPKIADASITTALIVNGAVIADKLATNAVTAEKIEANAVTADKINAGAITADKIDAGAVTADKLAANSVTADAIQAGSIIGDKISAGAINAYHLAAQNIDLMGALAITGGAVRLDENGLKVANGSNGGYTIFNNNGMNFFDSNGSVFAGVGRLVMGVANHGDYIRFSAPWDVVPTVIVTPLTLQTTVAGYTAANIFLNYQAAEVSENGFRVKAFTTLGEGSSALQLYNQVIKDENVNKDPTNGLRDNLKIVTPPAMATGMLLTMNMEIRSYHYYHEGDHGSWSVNYYPRINIILKQNETQIYRSETYLYTHRQSDKVLSKTFNLNISVSITPDIPVVIAAEVVYNFTHSVRDYNIVGYTLILNSIEYNVAGNTVVSTGSAFFIATDGNTPAYTIE